MFKHGRSILHYRHFIFASIKSELKGRFARSRIGALWFILHPLALALIYALVLSEVLGAKIGGIENKSAYAIYLMAGIAGWGLFSEITNRCIHIFIEYGATLKKISFPKICLPLIVWGGALLNHVLLLVAIAVVFAFYGHYPKMVWVILPLGILLISGFAFGLGMLLGVLNVFARDIAQVMSVILNLWFWLTPIVYTADIVPPPVQRLLGYNPMTAMIGIYQDALLYGHWPNWQSLIYPSILCVLLFSFAVFVFYRASDELVDEL